MMQRVALGLAPPQRGMRPFLDIDLTGPSAGLAISRATGGSVVSPAGLIQTAAAHAPRHDHDPVTGAARGLLIEPERTNILFPSTPGGGWTLADLTMQENAASAPDGTQGATRLMPTASSGEHLTYQVLTVAAGQSYCYSCWMKPAEYTKACLRIGAIGASAIFDLAAISVVETFGAVPIAAGIADAGNGWRRAWMQVTTPGTVFAPNIFPVADAYTKDLGGYIALYDGDPAKGILVWGAQVEAGHRPTSLIPTTGSTATRLADIATVAPGPWEVPTRGTLMVEWEAQTDQLDAGGTPWLAGLSDGTVGNALSFLIQAGDDPDTLAAAVVTDGIERFAGPLGGNVPGTVSRAALSWRENAVTAHRNGGTPLAGIAAATPGAITTLSLGHRPGGTEVMAGWLRRVRLYQHALSEGRLGNLTV